MSPRRTAGLAAAALLAGEALGEAHISIDFSSPAARPLKTSATLQVVSNPLLDRTFDLGQGKVIDNPIYAATWGSLKQLGADHVRFQPWFPFPHKSVAELDPWVPGNATSWNFTNMLPQLEDFMSATAGHPVTWNFGTIPCWMFTGPTTGGCPYPANPAESNFGYGERGVRAFLRDGSGEMLAEYFTRMFSYLINGFMVDENGVLHKGGPAYNMSAAAGHVIEFLNEGEHYYTASEYVHDYDVTIPHLQLSLYKDRTPQFMGIGGCHDAHWNWWAMGSCTPWLTEFLDRSKHKDPSIPLDWASVHFYASSSNRSNVASYTRDFFGAADKWFQHMQAHVALRDKLSPQTKIALTELGVLMLDDEAKIFGPDGGLPDLFFNAGGAFYAYVFGHIGQMGVDVACFSQMVGSPPIPEWGIPDMQFPSGAMLSWETGYGNAKYWTLALLLQHLRKGEQIVPAQVFEAARSEPARQTMCEAVGPWTFTGEITVTCADPTARINHIWVDAGLEPEGECGSYRPNPNCSNHLPATAWASLKCLGRHSCTLERNTNFIAQMMTCPRQTFRANSQLFSMRLTVEATCTGTEGGHTSAEYTGDSVYSVGFVPPAGQIGHQKLLLVNKESYPVSVTLNVAELAAGATAFIVDPLSVTRSSAQGIRQEQWQSSGTSGLVVTLQPFAVVIAVMNGTVTMPEIAVTSLMI